MIKDLYREKYVLPLGEDFVKTASMMNCTVVSAFKLKLVGED